MNYREDGMTPYVTIWKYGLTEMKVWIFQARRRWNIRHNTTWDRNVYVDKIKKHKGDRGFFCSYSLGETGLLLLNFLVIKRSYSFQVGREGGFFEQHFSPSSGFLFFDFNLFYLVLVDLNPSLHQQTQPASYWFERAQKDFRYPDGFITGLTSNLVGRVFYINPIRLTTVSYF